ncbi:MAG: hypothetical protein ACKVS6_07515 [Planctomycetota bacterium]
MYYSVLALLLLLSTACRSAPKEFPKFEGQPPATIAVLPIDGSLPPRSSTILRNLMGAFLTERQYSKLDDEFVDAELARSGYSPWNGRWLPGDAELAAFGRSVGVDALVVISGFEDKGFSAAVFYRRGLTGTVRWLDTRNARTLWSADLSASRSGGLLLESGQALKAVSQTVQAGSEESFFRLAASVSRELAEAVPENKNPGALQMRPRVESVSLSSQERLGPGVVWRVEARGTPRARGIATVDGLAGGFPLVETAPGIYNGTYRVEAGWGEAKGRVNVVLYNSFGDPSETKSSDSMLYVSAVRLDSPRDVRAEVADAASRKVRVAWSPVAGAAAYDFVRLGTSAPFSVVVNTTHYEDTIPAGEGSVFYAVSARTSAGNSGPASAPITIALASSSNSTAR